MQRVCYIERGHGSGHEAAQPTDRGGVARAKRGAQANLQRAYYAERNDGVSWSVTQKSIFEALSFNVG